MSDGESEDDFDFEDERDQSGAGTQEEQGAREKVAEFALIRSVPQTARLALLAS